WDKVKYAQLGKLLMEKHNALILLFGNEFKLNGEVNSLMEGKGIIASTSDYMDSMSRMAHCGLFVSNDTAFLHSAAAFMIPTVGIFGYTNSKELFPWKTKQITVRKDLECSPCFYNSPKPAHCKWSGNEEFKCIKEISVEEIYKACESLLNA
ncbi:glycosyltransferase family 9 protein, partial [bacterium]